MTARQARSSQHGYAMAALLVGIAVMGVLLSVAMPTWRAMVKRDREEELVFRGQQYARAIGLFQRKYANAYPPSLDVLIEQRYLRKKYTDPMTKGEKGGEGEFRLLYQASLQQRPGQPGGLAGVVESPAGTRAGGMAGQGPGARSPGGLAQPEGSDLAGPRGGIVGVISKSKDTSLRVFNGRTVYNEWQFVWSPAAGGPESSERPGMRRGQQMRPGAAPMRPSTPSGSSFDPRR